VPILEEHSVKFNEHAVKLNELSSSQITTNQAVSTIQTDIMEMKVAAQISDMKLDQLLNGMTQLLTTKH